MRVKLAVYAMTRSRWRRLNLSRADVGDRVGGDGSIGAVGGEADRESPRNLVPVTVNGECALAIFAPRGRPSARCEAHARHAAENRLGLQSQPEAALPPRLNHSMASSAAASGCRNPTRKRT